MATLLHHYYQRDIASEVSTVKTTFSSWDKCMTEAYCKWPAIVGIIIAVLIVFSLVWCLARCLCCGAEMCCGCLSCLSCCGSCCNNSRNRNQGYQQPQPTPQLQPYPQYASQPPPMYAMPQQPQYAQFDVHSGQKSARYNEDALPEMPSWNNARVTRTPSGHDVEMDRLNQASAPMLPKNTAQNHYAGDLGMMGGPYGQQEAYHHAEPSMSYADPYAGYGRAPPQQQQQTGYSPQSHEYEPSFAAPPSYRTAAPSVVNAPTIGRKPVSGTWRDI